MICNPAVSLKNPLYFVRIELSVIVLDERQTDVVVEAEAVVVRYLFIFLLQAIANGAGAAEGIQAGKEIEVRDLLPNPVGELGLAALIASWRETSRLFRVGASADRW